MIFFFGKINSYHTTNITSLPLRKNLADCQGVRTHDLVQRNTCLDQLATMRISYLIISKLNYTKKN